MQDVLLLRLEAPLMSFGATVVDNLGVIRAFPGRSMLVGLLGNALGYYHRDTARLQAFQSRLRYAVRRDHRGQEIVDFQTVDLGQPSLAGGGWTTLGVAEFRAGGEARIGTHIRQRHYLADAVYTVALGLSDEGQSPNLDDLEAALREPARPLFIGRKCCLPSVPLFLGRTSAPSLLTSLESLPSKPERRDGDESLTAWWPDDEDVNRSDSRLVPVTDDRDWANQVHVGRRYMREGSIHPKEATHVT